LVAAAFIAALTTGFPAGRAVFAAAAFSAGPAAAFVTVFDAAFGTAFVVFAASAALVVLAMSYPIFKQAKQYI
jgi:hypothetical protein